MAIFSKKIMIRHQYTILKHIPKEFPYRLHNQPITPATLIKKIHTLEKRGDLTTRQANETLEPDDMTLNETQELMDSITSDKSHPIPVRTIIPQGPSEQFIQIPTNTIRMRVPMQNTPTETTETEQTIEISSQSIIEEEAKMGDIDTNTSNLPEPPIQESAESQEGADNMQMSIPTTPDTSDTETSVEEETSVTPTSPAKAGTKKKIENIK
ncbi:hypothetical protein B484DRAFT_440027 [Ochromonadaceae sp. CCMP2298]|nr:hypothetical protein B484DRAFT_440027 [Ochromonadaceae sp. CCMP2298]